MSECSTPAESFCIFTGSELVGVDGLVVVRAYDYRP